MIWYDLYCNSNNLLDSSRASNNLHRGQRVKDPKHSVRLWKWRNIMLLFSAYLIFKCALACRVGMFLKQFKKDNLSMWESQKDLLVLFFFLYLQFKHIIQIKNDHVYYYLLSSTSRKDQILSPWNLIESSKQHPTFSQEALTKAKVTPIIVQMSPKSIGRLELTKDVFLMSLFPYICTMST